MRQISYQNFLKLLEIHRPVEIKQEHIKIAEDEKPNQPELIDIAANYPTIKTKETSGYILPTERLPFPFSNRLLHLGIGTPRLFGEQTSMISEMIENALYHGNLCKKDKKIYFLWHKCDNGKEIYIVDQGEKEWGVDKLLRDNAKSDELTGLDTLICRSKEFEYFMIKDESKMKGTFLRILLERYEGKHCNYFGHNLFKK